jgi:hypothetical protein
MVHTHEFEVTVGDIFRIGETTVTVIDIDNGEVTFRVDEGDSHDDGHLNGTMDGGSVPLPR